MPRLAESVKLDRVHYIVGSGTGVLDFSVAGEEQYYTWDGQKAAEWNVEDVATVDNLEEDRFIMYPDGEYFMCEIEPQGDEGNLGPVTCWCEQSNRTSIDAIRHH